ncbi:MAG: pilus assembly PilX N-terminal domain-containing protein [Nitrospirota bacterium]
MRTPYRTTVRENEQGYVLITSLIMLVVLSLLGAVVLNLSGADLQTAAYEKMSTRAFFAAESAVTQARNDMQRYVAGVQSGQWPALDTTVVADVLAGIGGPYGIPSTIPGPPVVSYRNYSTAVAGSSPLTFNYTMSDVGANNDKTVLVTATGTVQVGGLQPVQQRIEAVVRYEPPDQVGAQECVSSACTSADQSSGAAVGNVVNSTVTL